MRKEKEFTISYTFMGEKLTREEAIELLKENKRREQIKNERTYQG
jgi:predicted metal-dependent TIM-barrel fold hydrolase